MTLLRFSVELGVMWGARTVYDLDGSLTTRDRDLIQAYEFRDNFDAMGAQAHIAIDAHPEVTEGPEWEKERQQSAAAERTNWFPDVYVNGEDTTVTVDKYHSGESARGLPLI